MNPVTTSYDYDAPLSEAGDPTPKYFAIRQRVHDLTNQPMLPVPPATEKIRVSNVPMVNLGPITNLMKLVAANTKTAKYPMTFEQLDWAYGFIMYEATIPRDGAHLNVPGLKDRGHVMLDGDLHGILEFERKFFNLSANFKQGQRLQILVENQGRLCDGSSDFKGIIDNVTLDEQNLTDWTMTPLDFTKTFEIVERLKETWGNNWMTRLQAKSFREVKPGTKKPYVPSIFYGSFPTDKLADTVEIRKYSSPLDLE